MPNDKKFFSSFLNIVSDRAGNETSADPVANRSSRSSRSNRSNRSGTNIATDVAAEPLPSEDAIATEIANDSDYTHPSENDNPTPHLGSDDGDANSEPSDENDATDKAVEPLPSVDGDDSELANDSDYTPSRETTSQVTSDDGGDDTDPNPSVTNYATDIAVVPQPLEYADATGIATDSDYTPSVEIVNRNFHIMSDNVDEPLMSPSSVDTATDLAVESLRSEDSETTETKPVETVKDEIDTDAAVDEMTGEDLRGLTKRILRVAKEKNVDWILWEVKFMIDQRQRQNGTSETAKAAAASSMNPIIPAESVAEVDNVSGSENPVPTEHVEEATAVDDTNAESVLEDVLADDVPTENVEEEAGASDMVADVPTENVEASDSVSDVATENVEETSDSADDLPAENVEEVAESSDSIDGVPTENAEKEVEAPNSMENVTTDSAHPADNATIKIAKQGLDPSHPDSILSLPPLLRNSRSYDSDKNDAAKPISPRKSTEIDTSLVMSPTVRTSNKIRRLNISDESGEERSSNPGLDKRQLVILCNRKPATAKECKDQDLAMILCKNMGIIPCVIVSALSAENSSATKEEKLLVASMPSKESGETGDIPFNNAPTYTYPQFFVRNILKDQDRDESNSVIDYKGDYDTMEALYRIGTFGACSLEAVPVTSETGADDQSKLETFIDETNSSAPRFGGTSIGEPSLPSLRHKASEMTASELSAQAYQDHQSKSPDNLDSTNSSRDDSTNNSSGSINNISGSHRSSDFSLHMSNDSLLNTSHKTDTSYSHLDGMNQPKLNRSELSGETSLGDDLRMIFDIENERISLPASIAEDPDESQARAGAGVAAVATITEEEEEEESNATPVPASLATVPTIAEEDEEEDDEEDQQQSFQQSSKSMTVLSSGAIVKREIVMLKQREKAEPPGALPTHTNNSSRFLSQARSSLKSPPSSPQKLPSKPVESEPKKTMNPFYALNYYSGGQSDKTAQELESEILEAESTKATAPEDPPGDDREPMQEILDPPGDDGESIAIPTQVSDEVSKPEVQFMGVGACYLVFHVYDDELNIHYSESPMKNAVGVWTSPDIANFKESQGLSDCELIGTCASRVMQDAKNFCQGWCQFIKAAKIMDGTVTAMDGIGLPVDFYLYDKGRTIHVSWSEGKAFFDTQVVDAIACVPKGRDFPATGIVGKKWGKIAKKLGSVAIFKSLSSKKSKDTDEESLISRNTNNSKMIREVSVSVPDPRDESVITLNTFDVATPVASPQKSLSAIIDWDKSPPLSENPTVSKSPSNELPYSDDEACYLVYDPDSSGQLVEHYSKTPIDFAIGRWIPGIDKKIAGFKFKRNCGRSVLIKNCSGGVQGRKNFYSGWCQFVRSARNMKGYVTLWDTVDGQKGLKVDVCLYIDDHRPTHQTIRMVEGVPYPTENLIAVACIPKGTPFFDNMTADLLMWLAKGNEHGYSSKM